MKTKNLLIYLMLVSSSLQVFGQKKVKFGINAGLSYSSIYGFDTSRLPYDRSSAIGYSAGLVFDYSLSDKISLISNLIYDKKVVGHKLSSDLTNDMGENGTGETIKFSMNFNYITLPIVIQYYIKENTGLYINAGQYIGYLINQIDTGGGYSGDSSKYNKNYDFGLVTSFGYLFSNQISLEIRNNLGLINTSSYPVIGDGTNKNHSINIIIGYCF